MIFGYARISTSKQIIRRQTENILREYPTAKIIEEEYTGTTTDRPKFSAMLKRIKSGDTIIFDSVSRMSRNADEGMELYERLYNKGVELIFLKEPHINTSTYKNALQNSIPMTGGTVDLILKGINEYLLALAKEQIKIAFDQSEKEVADLHQRTAEGLRVAKENGRRVGGQIGDKYDIKKAKAAKKIILKHSKDFGGNLKDIEVMKLCGVAKASYYKYKAELKAEAFADGSTDKKSGQLKGQIEITAAEF